MKSLKALEGKYILIREAATPPAVPTVPAAPAAPAVPAAPIDPKVLAALNAPDSPLQPKKIEEISKDPVKLQAFAQNELPKIIDGIVAAITKTNPDAIPEILAAAKRNDLKTVQELLAKYSKEAAAAPAAAPAPAPAAPAPVMSTASYIPNSGSTVTEGVLDSIKDTALNAVKSFWDWFGFSGVALTALGLVLAGPIAAFALPLLVRSLQASAGSGNDSKNSNLRIIRINIDKLPANVSERLTNSLTNLSPGNYTKQQNTGISLADLDEFDKKIVTNKIKNQVANSWLLSIVTVDGGIYEIKREGGHYILKVVTPGSTLPKPLKKGVAADDPADDATPDAAKKAAAKKAAAATDKATAAVNRARAKGTLTASYVPFPSLANKVLKEFYKNSKPLPIEVANKK